MRIQIADSARFAEIAHSVIDDDRSPVMGRDVGLLAVRVADAERVRVNWRAAGSGTWRADVVTVLDDGLILAARVAGLCGRPGNEGSCRIVAWGRATGGLRVVLRTWSWSWPGCRAGGCHCPRPPYTVWLTTNPWK